MTVRPIIVYPDDRLHKRAEAVTAFDDSLGTLVDDLLETMAAHGAIGLSAPQVGDLRRVLVVAPPGAERPSVYVNPAVTARSAWGFVEESCLSLPGVVGSVTRATSISVTAQDPTGARFAANLDGMHAVSVQHEVDHLDGKLFIDRFTVIGRMRAKARLARGARERAAAARVSTAGGVTGRS